MSAHGHVEISDDELRPVLGLHLSLVHADMGAWLASNPSEEDGELEVPWCDCLTPDTSRGPWFCARCFAPIEDLDV